MGVTVRTAHTVRTVRIPPRAVALLLAAGGSAMIGVAAVAAAEIGFEPPLVRAGNVYCTDPTFSVALVVAGEVDGIQGFSIAFAFDPEIVSPIAVRPGTVLTGQPAPFFFFPWEARYADGIVQIDAAVLGTTCNSPDPEGGVSLAEIEFRKLGCATASPCAFPLDLVTVEVRDHRNRSIAVGDADGAVEIMPCILPVENSTWGRIKALHRS